MCYQTFMICERTPLTKKRRKHQPEFWNKYAKCTHYNTVLQNWQTRSLATINVHNIKNRDQLKCFLHYNFSEYSIAVFLLRNCFIFWRVLRGKLFKETVAIFALQFYFLKLPNTGLPSARNSVSTVFQCRLLFFATDSNVNHTHAHKASHPPTHTTLPLAK